MWQPDCKTEIQMNSEQTLLMCIAYSDGLHLILKSCAAVANANLQDGAKGKLAALVVDLDGQLPGGRHDDALWLNAAARADGQVGRLTQQSVHDGQEISSLRKH
jgi:hypothetical protein